MVVWVPTELPSQKDLKGATIAVVAQALRRGQKAGTVRSDIDPDNVAAFYLAASSGMMGASKSSQDPALMRSLILTGNDYLETLRALPVH